MVMEIMPLHNILLMMVIQIYNQIGFGLNVEIQGNGFDHHTFDTSRGGIN